MLEYLVHAQLTGALLQQAEKPHAADTAEPMAAAHASPSADMNGGVVLVMETRKDGGVRLEVRRTKVPHRLVGKHHAPAESVVRTVALVYFHSCRRQCLAHAN